MQYVVIGEGAVICEGCGENLREGASFVASAFRSIDQPAFQIEHVKCTECRYESTEYFTAGVRELVMDGRIGTHSEQATESSWPVLLASQPCAIRGVFVRVLQAWTAACDDDQPMPCDVWEGEFA